MLDLTGFVMWWWTRCVCPAQRQTTESGKVAAKPMFFSHAGGEWSRLRFITNFWSKLLYEVLLLCFAPALCGHVTPPPPRQISRRNAFERLHIWYLMTEVDKHDTKGITTSRPRPWSRARCIWLISDQERNRDGQHRTGHRLLLFVVTYSASPVSLHGDLSAGKSYFV